MKRIVVAAMVSILGAAGIAVALGQTAGASGRVYTVAELRAALAHDPTAWAGRSVLVRGIVTSGFSLVTCLAGAPCAARRFTPPVRSCTPGLVCPPHVPPPLPRCGRGTLCALHALHALQPAIVVGCPSGVYCWSATGRFMLRLTDPATPGTAGSLLAPPGSAGSLSLVLGSPGRLLTFLRGLPWVGRFMPGPQRLLWGTPEVYRVVLQVTRNRTCGAGACYQALVPDAAAPAMPMGIVSFPAPIVVPVHLQPVLTQGHAASRQIPRALVIQHAGVVGIPSGAGRAKLNRPAAPAALPGRHGAGNGRP